MSKKRKPRLKKKLFRPVPAMTDQRKEELFWEKIDERIRKAFSGFIQPIESRIDNMMAVIDNAKNNIIVTNTVLENKKIITKEEFFETFEEYIEEERGGVDGSGQMIGAPVISIYNMED